MNCRDIHEHLKEKGTWVNWGRTTDTFKAGDLAKCVAKVATGTGVTSDVDPMRELGADVGIVTDDGYRHVRMGAHAQEIGFPTLLVNHGVSEEWGVRNLAAYLARTFTELEVFHIPQRCAYTTLTEQASP